MVSGLATWRCSEDAVWVPVEDVEGSDVTNQIPLCSPGMFCK